MPLPRIGLIVSVCLLVIGAIFMAKGGSGGGEPVLSDNAGVVCLNPECGHKESVDRQKYSQMIKDRQTELGITDEDMAMGRGRGIGTEQLPLVCPKCEQESFVTGFVCDKCGEIYAAQAGAFRDKCPKCGYSRLEDIQKNLRK